MKSFKLIGITLTSLAITGAFLVSHFTDAERFSNEVHADYPAFDTLEKMENNVDAVVVASISKVNPSHVRKEEEVKDKKWVETDSEVLIEKNKKGNFSEKKILVKQDGGEIDGKKQKWDHVEYFSAGQKYILYLKKLENGKYAPINPIDGVLKITDGKVNFRNQEYNVSDIFK